MLMISANLSEHSASQNVSDCTVWRFPHLLQLELLNASLIRSDCGALNSDVILLDGVGTVDGHLIVGLIPVFDAQVEGFQFDVEEGQNQLFLDTIVNR